MPKRIALMSLAVGLAVTGCALRSARTGPPPEPVAGRLLSGVPHYPDSTDQCGPSTLASVLNYNGVSVSPETLREKIYVPHLKGTLPMDLLPTARSYGLEGEVYPGSLADIREHIDQGIPLLAYLNLGFSFYPKGHYVVVTGYDDERGGVFVHSGDHPHQFWRYKKFMKHWNKTDRWTLKVTK